MSQFRRQRPVGVLLSVVLGFSDHVIILASYTQGDSDVISTLAGFRRHLVGKTLINVFHCNIAEIRFVRNLVIIDQRTECCLNNTLNLRPLGA